MGQRRRVDVRWQGLSAVWLQHQFDPSSLLSVSSLYSLLSLSSWAIWTISLLCDLQFTLIFALIFHLYAFIHPSYISNITTHFDNCSWLSEIHTYVYVNQQNTCLVKYHHENKTKEWLDLALFSCARLDGLLLLSSQGVLLVKPKLCRISVLIYFSCNEPWCKQLHVIDFGSHACSYCILSERAASKANISVLMYCHLFSTTCYESCKSILQIQWVITNPPYKYPREPNI